MLLLIHIVKNSALKKSVLVELVHQTINNLYYQLKIQYAEYTCPINKVS